MHARRNTTPNGVQMVSAGCSNGCTKGRRNPCFLVVEMTRNGPSAPLEASFSQNGGTIVWKEQLSRSSLPVFRAHRWFHPTLRTLYPEEALKVIAFIMPVLPAMRRPMK